MKSESVESLRYGVVGLGAIGGYYGGLLARSGRDVHFLARGNFGAVAQGGLTVESPLGGFHLPKVNVYRRAEEMPRCDVVLVTLKATDNAALEAILPVVLAEGGTTVLVQNGLGQEERLPEVVLRGSVYAGLGFICVSMARPTLVVHQDYGALRLASFREAGAGMARHGGIDGLADELRRAGLEIEREEDFLSARWKKLVWNIPFNGLSVVLRADTADLLRERRSAALVESLMLEVIAAARAEGCAIPDEYAARMMDATTKMKAYLPSMHHDFVAGRALELDAMYWTPIARARHAGREMQRVEVLAQELSFLTAQRNAGARE